MDLNQPLLYTAPGTSSLVEMSCPAATASSFDPPSSSNLIPHSIQHTIWTGAVTNNGEPSCNFETHASDFRSLQDPSADDVIYLGQRSRKRRAVAEAIDTDDAAMRIGSVLSNRKFACDDEDCAGQTFARLAELRRHHFTHHAVDKPNFWCHVPTCPRSVSRGGEAFHRRDKLVAHVKSMHS
ncbi:hypothetical protein FB567DRAFT_246747 [Paraphoma chrysanthemicola]|uniref:C2H2-type domain-containing protein n=1 Tax=Paraphoma chrysanthemicola TaxID=798071 RepID=A0A8K0QST6_9PLEO|nr:hypothetical protein FB567DRAFT_246747 [Paraphoma chrysanthemicola]